MASNEITLVKADSKQKFDQNYDKATSMLGTIMLYSVRSSMLKLVDLQETTLEFFLNKYSMYKVDEKKKPYSLFCDLLMILLLIVTAQNNNENKFRHYERFYRHGFPLLF